VSTLRILSLAVLSMMPLCFSSEKVEAGPNEPVAIIYSLAGEAKLVAPSATVRPLRLFDRLPAGATLEVGPGSHLALAFETGLRYELGERCRVTLGLKRFKLRSGPVRQLSSAPPLPRLRPIAEDNHPGAGVAALRIRSEGIDCLSPESGAATLATSTILRFHSVFGISGYQVEIDDARGSVILRTHTNRTTVAVPPGVLAPNAHYHWIVAAEDGPGYMFRNEADFVTLSTKIAEGRERLRKEAEAEEDSGLVDLLAAVDHALGMTEACKA
jgi:hypothetical protein